MKKIVLLLLAAFISSAWAQSPVTSPERKVYSGGADSTVEKTYVLTLKDALELAQKKQ